MARKSRRIVAFDELHKFGKWKNWLKGFFDLYEQRARLVVTGSSKLDLYRRGGDSLMGRYFLFRMHPLSVGELLRQQVPARPINDPIRIAESDFDALWQFGGYPEPFRRRSRKF